MATPTEWGHMSTGQPPTIKDFLLARIAEDEAAAQRCADSFPGTWEVEDRGYHAHIVSGEPDCHRVAELDQRQTTTDWMGGALGMIADFQPARVLRECAAKRAIIEHWGPYETLEGEDLLRTLAAVYADHPDYKQEWALNG